MYSVNIHSFSAIKNLEQCDCSLAFVALHRNVQNSHVSKLNSHSSFGQIDLMIVSELDILLKFYTFIHRTYI